MVTGIINNRRLLSKTGWGHLGISNIRKVPLTQDSSPPPMPVHLQASEKQMESEVLSKVVQPKTCPVGYTTSLASWATLKHGFDECTAGIHTLDPCDVPFIYTTRRSGSLYHWFTVQTSNTEVCTVACGPDAGPPPVGGVCKGLPRRAGRMLLGVHGGWQYRFHASPTLPGELLYLRSQSHQLQVEQPRFPV